MLGPIGGPDRWGNALLACLLVQVLLQEPVSPVR
jgi:hypothetical protein